MEASQRRAAWARILRERTSVHHARNVHHQPSRSDVNQLDIPYDLTASQNASACNATSVCGTRTVRVPCERRCYNKKTYSVLLFRVIVVLLWNFRIVSSINEEYELFHIIYWHFVRLKTYLRPASTTSIQTSPIYSTCKILFQLKKFDAKSELALTIAGNWEDYSWMGWGWV